MFWLKLKEKLVLHFYNDKFVIESNYHRQFTQKEIEKIIKSYIGSHIYEDNGSMENVIGQVIDAKFVEIRNNDVFFEITGRFNKKWVSNPYVATYEDEAMG